VINNILFSDDKYELVIGQHVEILLNTTAYNQGESAYESRMFVVHPYSFNYIGTVKLEDVSIITKNYLF